MGASTSGVLCVALHVKARFPHMSDRGSLQPQHAEVSLVLEEHSDESMDYSEVQG